MKNCLWQVDCASLNAAVLGTEDGLDVGKIMCESYGCLNGRSRMLK